MKCHKCGFVSFDHLSECKSCGVDLKGIRDSLGFLPFEPSIPFFLGALEKSSEEYGYDMQGLASSTPSFDPSLPDIEFTESFELDTMELSPGAAGGAMPMPPQAREQMRSQLDEALRVFEDIESLKEKKGGGAAETDDIEIELDFDMDKGFAAKPQGIPAKEIGESETITLDDSDLVLEMDFSPSSVPEAPRESAAVDVSDEDLERLIDDVDLDKDLALELDFDSDTKPDSDKKISYSATIEMPGLAAEAMKASVPPVASPRPVVSTPASLGGTDGLELDLSEDDLEKIVLELEDVTLEDDIAGAGARSGRPAKADREKA